MLEAKINKILADIDKKTGAITEYDIVKWEWSGKPASLLWYDVRGKVANTKAWQVQFYGMVLIEELIVQAPIVEAMTSPSEYVRKYREFREEMNKCY